MKKVKEKVPHIGKPQRSKKHKKLKADDPFYHGVRKNKCAFKIMIIPLRDYQGRARNDSFVL